MNDNNKIEIKSFPNTEYEALALAFVNAQDLSGKTPAEVYRIYHNACEEIKEEHKKIIKEGKEEKDKKRNQWNF